MNKKPLSPLCALRPIFKPLRMSPQLNGEDIIQKYIQIRARSGQDVQNVFPAVTSCLNQCNLQLLKQTINYYKLIVIKLDRPSNLS